MGKTHKDRRDTRPQVVEHVRRYGVHPTRGDEKPKTNHRRRKPRISEVVFAFGEKALEHMERGKSTK